MECSECGNVMEFRGIAVRKKGHLTVQFVNDTLAKNYVNREIEIIESQTHEYKKKSNAKSYWKISVQLGPTRKSN